MKGSQKKIVDEIMNQECCMEPINQFLIQLDC